MSEHQPMCTVHQRLDARGFPMVQGSEVRLPDGSVIPLVGEVVMRAVAGGGLWETTITLRTRFGDPIPSCDLIETEVP